MSVSVQIAVTGDRALVAKIKKMPEAVRMQLTQTVTRLALQLETHVKRDKLQGQVLKHQTGRLQRSVHHKVTSTAREISAKVATGSDVPYAAIHEFGGTTRAHVIKPVKAKMLAFKVGGKQVFARQVNHPGSKIPERSYLRSALADFRTRIKTGMRDAVAKATKL